MHPAVILVLALFMTLMVGMPLVGWMLSRHHHDRGTRLWFSVLALDALQLPLVAMQTTHPGWLTQVLPSVIAVLFYVTTYCLLRNERRSITNMWLRVCAAGFIYTILATIVYLTLGEPPLNIYTFGNLVYLALSLLVAYQALIVGRSAKSLSMKLIGVGFIIGASGFVVRAYWHIVLQTSIPVFEFTIGSNYLVLAQAINLILICFGYQGYARDKAEELNLRLAKNNAVAHERQVASEQHAIELKKVIGERDQMVVANSRFLNLSAMAVFNSAIVHEISQPLQALAMCLEILRAKDAESGGKFKTEIADVSDMAGKATDIVVALRQLMAQGNGGLTESTDVIAALNKIAPIIKSDARQRGVKANITIPDFAIYCECNTVLFQRLVLNLVVNAFDALAGGTAESPTLVVNARKIEFQGRPALSVVVSDNGPGMSQEVLDGLFKPFATQKPTGMGIGLSLADILLRKWGGRITVHNLSLGVGTEFEVILPESVSQ